MAKILNVENISVKYGGMTAVNSVSLELKKGKCIALLGANGGGKSSIMCSISGAIPISHGKIKYLGNDISDKSVRQRVMMGIAMVPEGRRVFPLMSVKDNMIMGGYTRPMSRQKNLERMERRFPILKEKESLPAMNLSGGEQQQLAIARAMMSEPALLLLDEPTMGLSPKMCEEVFGYLDVLRKDGITMIIASQETSKMMRFCDEGLMVTNGRIRKI